LSPELAEVHAAELAEETALAWPLTPSPPALEEREVHVWCWNMAAPVDELPALRAQLSDDERARGDRFVFDRDRIRFTAAHARLRRLLAAYADRPAASLLFHTEGNGKPALTGEPALRFNLSHSHNLALLAVSRDYDLGVDIERIRPISDGIAERFFAEPERDALRTLPPEARLDGFYSCWTRKEAFLKGIATGLSGGLDSFAVSLLHQDAAHPPTIRSLRGHETAGWHLAHLDPAPNYLGALAVKGEGWSVRRFAV
jgi:4'-phosphopantetheinyl transferase